MFFKANFNSVKSPEVDVNRAEVMAKSRCKKCYGRGYIEYNPADNLKELLRKYCSCTKSFRSR